MNCPEQRNPQKSRVVVGVMPRSLGRKWAKKNRVSFGEEENVLNLTAMAFAPTL